MIVIPSIDFLRGRPCRLYQGDPSKAEFYEADPVQRALQFQELDAMRFHLVNLDGALGAEASALNLLQIQRVVQALSIPVQVGGGIRTGKDVVAAAVFGVDFMILGTSALAPDEEIQRYLKDEGSRMRLIADIGFEGNEVKVKGWQEKTGLSVTEALNRICNFGFLSVIMTDKSRDGAQTGPNLAVIAREAEIHPDMKFIISGGISTREHLDEIVAMPRNVIGFIMGKRLWADDGFDFFKMAVEMFT
nr:hypothetical protein [uncultured bacterium]